ncbi:MAG TPA: DUF1684 domain-containing protein, partial [Vicinamibacteria bacterium]|nr:DUF1684 domain-containing protein [Vicinamibacteria bacterium]
MMILTAALGLALLEAAPAGNETPRAETLAWRAKREADLKADQGWLAVSGLPWLKEGETTVGSG